MIYEKLGGRKAVMTIILVGVGAAVDILAKAGLSQNLLSLLAIALGAFVTGNGIEHAALAFKARGKKADGATPAAQVDLSGIEAAINQLGQGQQAMANRLAVAEQTAKTVQQSVLTLANKISQYE